MEINELSLKVSNTLSYYAHAQEVIALNVANVNQEGYVAKSVDFQMFLNNLESTGSTKESLEDATVSDVRLSVDLDDQIAQSEQVAMKFAELTEAYSRYFALYQTAANKGR